MRDLLQIQATPTAENAAIRLHPDDNIAIARVPLDQGSFIHIDEINLRTLGAIPAGHKIALRDIAAGENVIRYGCSIGTASIRIAAGSHVHTHNLTFVPAGELSAMSPDERPLPSPPPRVPSFMGYAREDGRAGTRNYVAIAAVSNCAAHVSQQIAAHFANRSLPPGVDGVVAFPHGEGCGHSIGPDTRQLHRVISGVMQHPNVGAGLLIGLGCEVNQISEYPALAGLTLQENGGTRATVQEGVRQVEALLEQAAEVPRTPVPVSKLVLGLNCGGSDSFSGISANPALGSCVDRLVALAGTAVLAETTEIFGAESLLLNRARNPEVARKLIACVQAYRAYLARFGGSFDDNPSPGNKQGGLTNIVEKSLGAVAKGGTAILAEVVDYAERIPALPGLVFMNTPGYDPVSLTGLAAGGVNVIAFTTGRGSAIGFPTVPVLKISSNTSIYDRMRENIDVNAGGIMDGSATVSEVGQVIFDRLLEVASGTQTSSERLGHQEFVPWRIGPVL
ncbi:MAG: altronate dehydratase family protein [Acidobacteriota bacterium]